MAIKTFKIGEYCRGGVITAMTHNNWVTLIGKEWDQSAGDSKSSDQSNAKEFTRFKIETTTEHAIYEIEEWLNDMTTSFYTDQIIQWLKSHDNNLVKSIW